MEYKGSFIGFTFGNRHSSTLGILRTSNSNRYELNLTPKIVDKTIELEGVDGAYYFGSNYSSRELSISFAFFGMTEEQLTQIKQIFNDKKLHDLILDEEPYKIWSAKLNGSAIMKRICFQDGDKRFYAGEGTFTFLLCSPYARSRYEYIEYYTESRLDEWNENNKFLKQEGIQEIIYPAIMQYEFSESEDTGKLIGLESSFSLWLDEVDLLTDGDYSLDGVNSYITIFTEPGMFNNLSEWREASGIPSNTEYGDYSHGAYNLYNAGDVDMPFQIWFSKSKAENNILELYVDGSDPLKISGTIFCDGDAYICIDTRAGAIFGCDENKKYTTNLYNKYIIDGYLFSIPVDAQKLYSTIEADKFEYHYLYL